MLQRLTWVWPAQFTFLQDDLGVPANYRHMEGFGVHTYTLLNKEGRVTYVKFHWQPSCGEPLPFLVQPACTRSNVLAQCLAGASYTLFGMVYALLPRRWMWVREVGSQSHALTVRSELPAHARQAGAEDLCHIGGSE